MQAVEIIRRKRDGEALSSADLQAFIRALSRDELSEGQIAAFAMAVFLRGMSDAETVALTLAMRDSGTVLSWKTAGRPVADKHSTGGVGDNVSLMLSPMMAACGLAVPMISGRGLGHTGGTLDKLESIPGYDIAPDASVFRALVEEIGCAIIGQTADLAPADKRLYAVRDVTATVESVPLITASILSKKLASGLESLVMDVKFGNGAFMGQVEEARALTRSLVAVANGAGTRTSALLTDMNEPLADCAGNAVEIANAVAFLKGDKVGTRLETVTLALGAEMLVNAGVEPDRNAADIRCRQALKVVELPRFSDAWCMGWAGRWISSTGLGNISPNRCSTFRFLPRNPASFPRSPPAILVLQSSTLAEVVVELRTGLTILLASAASCR